MARRRASLGHLLCLSLLVVAVSSCGSDETGVPGATTDGSELPFSDAFDLYVQSTIGFTPTELNQAIEYRQYAAVSDCLAASGWDEDLRSIGPPRAHSMRPANVRGYRTYRVLSYLQTLEDTDFPKPDQPTGFLTAESACVDEAASSNVDPLAPTNDFLELEAEELEARLQSDDRVVDAFEQYRSCITDLGFVESDIADSDAEFTNRANEILDAFGTGSRSKADALTELERLQAEELAELGRIDGCLLNRLVRISEANDDLLRDYIEANEQSLNQLLVDALPLVRDLTPFIVANAEGSGG